jgi:hypothetical protein
MAEFRIGAIANVGFHFLPVPFVVADVLAGAADRQHPRENFDLGQRFLKLVDELFALSLNARPLLDFKVQTFVQPGQLTRTLGHAQLQKVTRLA